MRTFAPRTFAPLFILLTLLLLAACGQSEPTATIAVPTVAPTSADAVAQAEPSATTPPTLTVTSPPPQVTTATPLPSPTPTATPSAVLLLTAEDFGDTRNPLTGELVEDPSVLDRRPIAVKIPNAPAGYVRPQSGPSQADLVFEHITEGPITRFTAIFYGEIPPDIGPIRSGRLIDLELPVMYDTAFAYSGASIGVSQRLMNSDFLNRILRPSAPGYYRTGADKPFEHTFYADPNRWYQELTERGENHRPQFNTYMAFGEETPPGGAPANAVTVNYRNQIIADWVYDEESGRWLRWTDGEEHMDANNDEQLSAANVVVVYSGHEINYDICEHQVGDTCRAFSMEIQIWGQGDALIFRDGQQFEATWRRENRGDMLTFYNAEGQPIPLQIGNTWFQMVPYWYEDAVTVK